MKNRASMFGCAVRGLTFLATSVALAGCASNSLPSPVITSLNPSSATAGGPSFTLKVIGTGFLNCPYQKLTTFDQNAKRV